MSSQFIQPDLEKLLPEIEEQLHTKGYCILNNFITLEQCELVKEISETLISRWYNKENLLAHSAYVSDDNTGRRSWAFALQHPTNPSIFPTVEWDECFQNEKEKFWAELTSCVQKILGITQGRTLFNMQKYWSKSLPVHAHRDGEVFEVDLNLPNRYHVVRALHPKKVGLLTLFNEAEGGGTRIFKNPGTDDDSFVVCGQPGDLLIFDNVTFEHGVDELLPKPAMKEGEVIRQIIGWRGLENDCKYLNRRFRFDPFKDVSYGRACELQQHFFEKIWPGKREEMIIMKRLNV